MHPAFTIKDSLSFAWGKLKENFGFLVILTLAFFVLASILNQLGKGDDAVGIIAQLLNLMLSYFSMFTFVRIGLKLYKGEKPTWDYVMDFDPGVFGYYVLGALVFTLAYVCGMALLIIPGIIVAVRFGFFGFAILEGTTSPFAAMKKSLELTRGRFWQILGFSIVMGLLNILGAILLVVGVLITAPLCLIATVYVYEKLKAHPYHPAHAHVPAPAHEHHAHEGGHQHHPKA